jgi:hypothetical protein
MTDRNRNQDPHRGSQPSSTESQRTAPQQDETRDDEGMGSPSRHRDSERESADDRGFDADRSRDVAGDRDELDRDDSRAIDDSDELDMDDGLGGPDRSER